MTKDGFLSLQLPLPEPVFRFLVLVFSFGFYGLLLLVFRVIQPDLDEHIVIAENMFTDGKVPAHPFFYFLIRLFSAFSLNFKAELFAAFVVFSLAQAAKLYASRSLVETIFSIRLSAVAIAGLFLCQLVISFSVSEPRFIINQISPNYFHNGTLQLSLPFALWCLREAIVFSRSEEENPPFRFILYSGFLCGLAKPSFLFCFIPSFPVFLFFRHGLSRKLLSGLQVATLFSFLVMGQSFYLKINPPNYVTSFRVLFLPFYQFGSLSSHLSMLVFGGFCAWAGILLRPSWWRNPLGIWLLGMWVFSLGISFTLVDEINGDRYSNMTWQTSVLFYLLLLVSFGAVVSAEERWKKVVFGLVLVAGALYGLQYLYFAVQIKSLFI